MINIDCNSFETESQQLCAIVALLPNCIIEQNCSIWGLDKIKRYDLQGV